MSVGPCPLIAKSHCPTFLLYVCLNIVNRNWIDLNFKKKIVMLLIKIGLLRDLSSLSVF